MEGGEEEIERIPDELFNSRKKKQLLDKVIRIGILFVLLIWGTVLLLRSIPHHSVTPDYQEPDSNYTKNGKLKVSFANVRNNTFQPNYHSLQWINANKGEDGDLGLYVTFINDSYVAKSVYEDSYNSVLLKGKTFLHNGQNLTVQSITASPDLKQLLIRTNSVQNWRHSTFGSYFVYNEESASFDLIGNDAALAIWSPNSNNVAYVQDNNIYVYSTASKKTVRTVTDDGSSLLFNGKPDWVYEEEVFEDDKVVWWSPTGDYLAFLKIDESEVGEFIIPYYVQNDKDVYPEVRSIKYPKSGTPNPRAELWVYSMKDGSSFNPRINGDKKDTNLLITEVTWVGDGNVLVKTTDRSSDLLTVYLIDTIANTSHVVRNESARGGWWEITHNTLFIPKNETLNRPHNGYVDILPINGYNHLAYFENSNNSHFTKLTEGEWEVVNGPLAFDSKNDRLYFISTQKNSTERHLYYVNLQSPDEIIKVTDISKDGAYDVSFSSGKRFGLLTYKGPKVPYQKIIDFHSLKTDKHVEGNVLGETLYYLERNEEISKALENYSIPKKSFKELNLGKDEFGTDIFVNAYEILPNDFEETLSNHYPVFFFAYGGPNSQQVIKMFSVGFNEVVASQLNAIVVVVDGRGTGFKGQSFRSLVRDRLGDYEARDQISAAALYSSLSFVDSEKISLFGWSYGGYLTLKTLEKDAGKHFKYGMSVAPVTDWRFYDSVYTERYMHTPQENFDGYVESSVHNVTSLAQANRFLLMHGTGDDNVHFQNSLKFLDLLNLNGVENYDVHVFPDSDHSIRYHNANVIVFDKLLAWARHAFNGEFVK
ncbi:dap2p [Saccharomyces arboricola H-6]|uniref:Dap2p n=1 Tax=Saccharomyces arboricola (strain H-6 / AS 2.3317 / CBS 10644) TaxID=1160507 RepID=J8LMS9_SACAR|nr:dap2p [Saccharomyces arboricola H-6]